VKDSDAPVEGPEAEGQPAATADYKARREEFVTERRQKRAHEMTPARILRNRMNRFKSGRRAKTVTPLDYIKFRLGRVSKDLPDVLEACFEAQMGNHSKLDQEIAKRLAANFILHDMMLARIMRQGAAVKEPILDSKGRRVGYRVKPHPLLDATLSLGEQLGVTAEQARVSRRSRGKGARDDAITEALMRDARIRAAKNLQLPPAVPELLREDDPVDTEVEEEDEKPPS
jgi:hypothetical protein